VYYHLLYFENFLSRRKESSKTRVSGFSSLRSSPRRRQRRRRGNDRVLFPEPHAA
jgi:hypothetical protein